MDVNGDGLPDFVRSYYSPIAGNTHGNAEISNGFNLVLLNTGSGWATSTIALPTYATIYDQYDTERNNEYVDWDGDGIPDNENIRNNTTRQDVLTQITYPKGGNTQVSYVPSPQTGTNSHMPMSLLLVSKIVTNDNDGNSTETDYAYSGGKLYLNVAAPQDRKFAGFYTITETHPDYLLTTYYDQGDSVSAGDGEQADGYPQIGHVFRQDTKKTDGTLLKRIFSRWDTTDEGNGRSFVYLSKHMTQEFDSSGSSHKDHAVEYTYSTTTGDLTQSIDRGEVSGSSDGTYSDVGSDTVIKNITYATNASTTLDVIDDITLTDVGSTKIMETQYLYDNLSFGSVGAGNRTQEKNWISGSSYASTTRAYNSFGLVGTTTDALGNLTKYVYDALNYYPASTTNALNQTSQVYYDYASGKVATTTDPNGLTNVNVYDPVGRLVQVKQPDQTSSSTLVVKTDIAYTDNTFPSYTLTTNRLSSASSTTAYEYFDGLGRTIQTRTQAPGNNTYVVKDTVYNTASLLSKESLPYFASSTAYTSPTASSSLLTTYTYDSLQRVSTAVNAVGTTGYAYLPWHTVITDANGNVKDLSNDAFSNLVTVVEHSTATSSATITYIYDLNNNLTKVTDANGNVRNFTYDGLNRRLTAEDLHMVGDGTFGSWSYSYDTAGNLIQRVDPKSQTVNFTYDALNRSLTEDYTGQAGTEVTYTYDSCMNGIGQLCVASTTASRIAYTYNPIGLKSGESESVVGTSTTFVTQYSYDRQGNQTLIIYPDSAQAQYNFNSAGLLDSVWEKENGGSSKILAMYSGYIPTGQYTQVITGSGATTTYTYDPTQLYRLTAKLSYAAATTTIAQNNPVQILVVAGGGGGSGANNGNGGGGGGAGGVISSSSISIPPGAYTVTVGSGGAGGPATVSGNGSQGATSSIGILVSAAGGGYGSATDGYGHSLPGGSGGSGGGAGTGYITGGVGGSSVNGEGNSGGASTGVGNASGGGGGAGSSGNNATVSGYGANGGTGIQSSITGIATYYAGGGGGGGGLVGGTGGVGGGGNGSGSYSGGAGTPNTGSGGGGGSPNNGPGGVGGSGIVIIRYPTANAADYTCGGTASTSGVDTICTYTMGGTFTVTNTFATSTHYTKTQDLHYVYDPNGNIISRTDNSDLANGQMVVYTYDGLNRLLSASTAIVGNGAFNQTYTYDSLGNITSGPLGSYLYTGNTGSNYANPDAVTALTTFSTSTMAGGVSTSTVVWGATSTSTNAGYNAGPVTKTWTQTVATSSSMLVLYADIWQDVGGTGTITSATWNGASFTKATSTRMVGIASEVWYLVATTTGSKTVSVTVTGATDGFKLAVASFSGVATVSPIEKVASATGLSGNPTISLSNVTGGDLVTATLSRYSTVDATTSRTSLYKDLTGSIFGAASYQVATTTSTYSDTYTGATSQDWSMLLVALRAATTTAAGGTATTTATTTLTYDQNGNLLSDGTNTYAWDYNNRLIQSGNGLATSTYAYDYQGNRIKFTEGTITTITPNTLYNVQLGGVGTTTKHIYANDLDLATIENTSATSSGGGTTTATSTPTFVQGNIDSTIGSVTFPNPVTQGDLVVVAVSVFGTTFPANDITDSKGNTYTKINEAVNTTNGGDHVALYYAKNVTGGSSFTVTSATAASIAVQEYSGVATSSPLDKIASSTGATGYPNPGNVTTTLGSELYVGAAWSATTGDTWTPAPSYTVRQHQDDNDTHERLATEDTTITTASTTAAKLTTTTSGPWAAVMATFKPLVTTSTTGGTTTATTTVRYIATDNLTGSNIITDSAGNVIETLDYYPYGQTRLDTKAGAYQGEKRKYAGTEYDAGSGLNYMQARYQSPTRGQFISEDPVFWETQQNLSDPQSLNSYSYANDNPINKSDPNGRCAGPAVVICIAAGVGFVAGGVSQYGSDVLGNINQNGLRPSDFYSNLSSPQDYARSAVTGAVVGASSATAGILGAGAVAVGVTAGAANFVTTAGVNYITNKQTNYGTLAYQSVVTGVTGGVLKGTVPGTPGRLPSFGSTAFYTGSHTTMNGAQEFVGVGTQMVATGFVAAVAASNSSKSSTSFGSFSSTPSTNPFGVANSTPSIITKKQ